MMTCTLTLSVATDVRALAVRSILAAAANGRSCVLSAERAFPKRYPSFLRSVRTTCNHTFGFA